MKLLTIKQVYALYLIEGWGMKHIQAAKVMKLSRAAVTALLRRAKESAKE